MAFKLFDSPEDCCGCGSCMNACPKGAISIKGDEFGFRYPVIDNDLCVECGECLRVCGYQKEKSEKKPLKAYAAASRSEADWARSSSGGIFAALAREILHRGGAVFGSALVNDSGALTAKHICIENEDELPALQGSKYTQSDTGDTFGRVRKMLSDGRTVLYSGTPCQIAGLKAYLKKPYEDLYTVDIICHGVPNSDWFSGFQENYFEKTGYHITEYSFRNKTRGQGKMQVFTAASDNGKSKEVHMQGELNGYMGEFTRNSSYRESCYSCRFASLNRVSDITIGDYWGCYEEHGKELSKKDMNDTKGISCVLVNTPNGSKLFDFISDGLDLIESTSEQIAKHNEQLRKPSERPACREKVLARWKNGGYAAVEEGYKKDMGVRLIYFRILGAMPKSLKRKVRMLLGKSY